MYKYRWIIDIGEAARHKYRWIIDTQADARHIGELQTHRRLLDKGGFEIIFVRFEDIDIYYVNMSSRSHSTC